MIYFQSIDCKRLLPAQIEYPPLASRGVDDGVTRRSPPYDLQFIIGVLI